MADPVWYYARGEVERGPFTLVQIKALANAGRLRRDDLVWKEGMENWTSAAEIAELFPAAAPGNDTKPAVETTESGEIRVPSPLTHPEPAVHDAHDLFSVFVAVGRGCLFLGVLAIVLARGCESLGERRMSRSDALARLEAAESWHRQRQPLVAELESLQQKGKLSSVETERKREVTQQLSQIDTTNMSDELAPARRLDEERATAEFRAGALTRGLAFHGGVLVALIGGYVLATFGRGSDRWLGVGLLLVVGFAALSAVLD